MAITIHAKIEPKRPTPKSFLRTPVGIIRLLILVSEVIVCICFPFIVVLSDWGYWKYINDAYIFYACSAVFAVLTSLIVIACFYKRFYLKMVNRWPLMMIILDIIFLILALVNAIGFLVKPTFLNPPSRETKIYYYSNVTNACAGFSFISALLQALDIFFWTRPKVSL